MGARESKYSRDLTDKESEVLQQMMLCKSVAQIARDLGLTLDQVKGRKTSIFNRLGASNRVEAVIFATNMGKLDQYLFWGS